MCNSPTMKENKEIVPGLMKFWGGMYNFLPKTYFPGTDLAIGMTLVSSMFFTLVRTIYEYLYTEVLFDGENAKTLSMASCNTSMTHSLLLVPSLWQVLRNQPYRPAASIVGTPKYYQDAVHALLQFCTGYMLYDFVFLLKDNGWAVHPDDVAFIGHHFVTVIYMTQTRVLKAGHISAITLMWSGEFTNPMQNCHCISRFAIQLAQSGSFWHLAHPYIELVYATFYSFFRAVVGPLQIVHITYDLLTKEGRKNIPLYIAIPWIIMINGIIIGSIPWTKEAIDMVKDGLHVTYHETYDYGERYEL